MNESRLSKLKLWKTRASSGSNGIFEQMHALILGRNMDFSVIKCQVIVHLSGLLDKCNSYIHELTEEQTANSFLPVDCKPIY